MYILAEISFGVTEEAVEQFPRIIHKTLLLMDGFWTEKQTELLTGGHVLYQISILQ